MGQESFSFSGSDPGPDASASDLRRSARARRPQAPRPRDAGPEDPKALATPRSSGDATPAAEEPAPALTVTELTRSIDANLKGMGRVRVEGEITGLKRSSTGHVYFDLSDEGARLSCVVWRSRAERAFPTEPTDGAHVLAHGTLDVYAPQGRYKLMVDRVEPLGLGALLARLEALKVELRAQGRFDRTRPLPAMPKRIGIVTSRDGAALRDFLRTRSQRWPRYPVRLCHAAVQGPTSAAELAEAILRLDRSGVDVIVVTRGGGSLEDLWSFNEAVVAEAIWNTSVPVVSAVGHETDTCLSDFVADHRAHTPTDAAQTVIPDRAELLARIERAGNRLSEAVDEHLETRADRVRRAAGSRFLRDPRQLLERRRLVLAETRARLSLAARRVADGAADRLDAARRTLARETPERRLVAASARLVHVGNRLVARGADVLVGRDQSLRLAARSLEAISPLAVLGRGYSITTLAEGGQGTLTSAAEVEVGARLSTRFARGRVVSRVEEVEPGADDDSGEGDPAR